MRGWPCDHREFQAAVLKLAINTTNTQEGAVVFDDAELLSLLADCIGKGFTRVQDAIGNGSLEGDVYHELLLMLGVMINIVEHSPPARSSLKQASLDGLVSLWRQNRQAMTEADSVEKSKVSVAMSYLAPEWVTETGSEVF
ncbi:hypothetical protein CDD83_4413 [Cordyceps sp. RAO-2017]|nr:hypothetical protein CDD83_4413 [Cordyceps sp. RAO-2017]